MIRRLLDMFLTLLFFGLPCLFTFTYTGPYKWLAEAQIAVAGRYYEVGTFVVTLALWMSVCTLAAGFVGTMVGVRVPFLGGIRWSDSLLGRQARSIVYAATLSTLAIAGYYEYRYKTITDVTHVRVNDLASKTFAPGSYICIEGDTIDSDLGANLTEESDTPGKSTSYYMPLLPADYQLGRAVHAYVEIDSDQSNQLPQPDPKLLTTGIVGLIGLPGSIRVQLEQNKVPPASHYVVITYGSTPANLQRNAELFLFMAVVVIGAGILTLHRVRKIMQAKANGTSIKYSDIF